MTRESFVQRSVSKYSYRRRHATNLQQEIVLSCFNRSPMPQLPESNKHGKIARYSTASCTRLQKVKPRPRKRCTVTPDSEAGPQTNSVSLDPVLQEYHRTSHSRPISCLNCKMEVSVDARLHSMELSEPFQALRCVVTMRRSGD